MNYTKIEYLDLTWNPLVGCTGFECAIKYACWARKQAKRQKHRCDACYSFLPHSHYERFGEPLKRKKPSRIGTCFMGDFFDSKIKGCTQFRIKDTIQLAKWHKFLVLTKQPQNALNKWYPNNVALGVSVNLKKDLWRLNALRKINAILKVVSFEPLLEDLGQVSLEGFGWIIIGAQTRPSIQPKREWVHRLTANALAKDIPVFHKNNLLIDGKLTMIPSEFMVKKV